MCVYARAGDRGVAWLACSIQRVMSAPINVGLCVRALVGLRLLCVFSFVVLSTQETRTGTRFAPTAIDYDKLGVAARGRISVPPGSIMTFVSDFLHPPSPLHRRSCCRGYHIVHILTDMWTRADLRVARGYF